MSKYSPYVSPGMPALKDSEKTVSLYEFWPTWVMYLPVVVQWLALSVWYRSLTLPLLANPKLPLAGMVGIPKSELLSQAQGACKDAILDWMVVNCTDEVAHIQEHRVLLACKAQGFELPFVCKPDIGCRGSGVKLIQTGEQLGDYFASYPEGTPVMIQQLASWEPEAGVFFVKEPGQSDGEIVSMALKYSPYVVGDGHSTLAELIANDPRAGGLQHLYHERHSDKLDHVLSKGEPFKLVFSASHCRGAIFTDARDAITPQLTQSINAIMNDLPEFYYGRMDIKFKDIESLKRGETLQIVEINAASSESLHIWDKDTPMQEAFRSLLYQYRTLFKWGALNRKRGFKPPSIKTFYQAWRRESALQRFYPLTD